MLTENWVNNLFALVSALVLVWVWRTVRREARERGATPPGPSFADAYRITPHVHHNRSEIERSAMCACLGCEQRYASAEVTAWRGDSAICPRCGRETVVGSGAGFALTPALVRRAHTVQFPDERRRVLETSPPEHPYADGIVAACSGMRRSVWW